MKGGREKRTKDPRAYRHRFYRDLIDNQGLIATQVRLRETDLHIMAVTDVTRRAGELVAVARLQIEQYISRNRAFSRSLVPLPEDILAPPIVRRMFAAANKAGVGPMAAVAGAIAEYVGHGLVEDGHKEIIIENGGDIFLLRSRPCTIAVFAGASPLSNRFGLRLAPESMPVGVCTSSGTVGHSLSFGRADAVTVVADSAIVADAAATRLGNEAGNGDVAEKAAVNRVLAVAQSLLDIRGVVVVCGETMGAVGDVELVPVTGVKQGNAEAKENAKG